MKLTTKFTTAVTFWEKHSTYTAGQGNTTEWIQYAEGSMTVFPCEWRGTHGNAAITANAAGVLDSARVRMPYIPALCELLRTVEIVVVKNADENAIVDDEPDQNNPNVYTVWGGVDDMQEEHRYIEFTVRRYEVTG